MKQARMERILAEKLEDLIIELDDEDRKILPKWRVKCIEIFNSKIKDLFQ